MLHTVNKSPFEKNSLESCLNFLEKDDVVLLFEDGIYAASTGTTKSQLVETILKKNKVFALDADLKARGISELIEGVEIADYNKFVDLVEAHKVQAWL